jgi:hypothetical protein
MWDRPVLDPVTDTVNDPVAVDDAVQESVEVPLVVVVLRPTLAGVRVHVRPVDGETASVRLTVPVNVSRLVIVMVEVPVPLEGIARLAGLAVTVKS